MIPSNNFFHFQFSDTVQKLHAKGLSRNRFFFFLLNSTIYNIAFTNDCNGTARIDFTKDFAYKLDVPEMERKDFKIKKSIGI